MQVEGSTFLVTGGSSGLGGATVRMLASAARSRHADITVRMRGLCGRTRRAGAFRAHGRTSEPQVQASIETPSILAAACWVSSTAAGIVTPRRVLDKDGIVHPLDLFARASRSIWSARSRHAPWPPGDGAERAHESEASWRHRQHCFDRSIRWSDRQACYSASQGRAWSDDTAVLRRAGSLRHSCHDVAPGVFETPMALEVSEAVRESLTDLRCFGRLGRPSESPHSWGK